MASLIQDKRGIFYIVSCVNGKRVWKSTRTRDRKEAYRTFLEAEEFPVGVSVVPLSKHIADYIEHVKATFGTKTYRLYELSLNSMVRFTGDVPLSQITSRSIDMYKIKRMRTVSASTTNMELRSIRTFFNCMKRWEIVAKNPCDGVAQVRIPQQLPPYLTMEQLQMLSQKITDEWLRRIVLFAAMTGARLGEVLNLTWDKVDLDKKVVLIQSSVSYQVKGGKVRSIPLNQTALDVLLEFKEREGLVFRGKRGGTANPNHVSAHFRRAARKAELDKRLHFHSLRHTFASLLVQKGVSLYQVQKLLGHSSPRVTEVYAHLQNPELHGAVDIIRLQSSQVEGTNVDISPPLELSEHSAKQSEEA